MVSCWLSRPTCCVADMEAHEWSCLSGRFVDGFQELPRQFGRVWSSEIFNRFETWLVVLSGSTIIKKKTMKWKEQDFYARAMAELPRILFGRWRSNVRYARLGLIKWLKYSPRKALTTKLPVRYQGQTLRFPVNVNFSFVNNLFGLKIDDK